MPFTLTLFSDFSCPFSYVTETALREMGLDERVEIVYRAFELYPEPEPLPPPDVPVDDLATLERLARFHELSLKGATTRPRTRKAHEASRFARDRAVEGTMRDRIFAAYWGEGRDIGRIDVLMGVAADVGSDPQELKIALDIDRYTEEVVRDEEVARRLRVPGTPTLFIGTGPTARVITGAHGPAVLRTMIEEGMSKSKPAPNDV